MGELVCQKCSGTGLPVRDPKLECHCTKSQVNRVCGSKHPQGTKLKGLMRDPIFAKVAYRLKKQRSEWSNSGEGS